jgi:hypothetical protein
MKKTLTGLLTLLAGAAVHAQGTVSLSNYGTSLNNYLYVAFKPTMGAATDLGGANTGTTPTLSNYNTASVIHNGNDWSVQLYAAAGSGTVTLAPVGTSVTFANGATDPDSGTWFSSQVVNIPNTSFAGTTVTVQLYAWYNEGGLITSYSAALADGVPTGYSGIDTTTTGGPPSGGGPTVTAPGLPLPAMGNFNVAVATPEPSTIALGVIGASTFLMRLRRKQ